MVNGVAAREERRSHQGAFLLFPIVTRCGARACVWNAAPREGALRLRCFAPEDARLGKRELPAAVLGAALGVRQRRSRGRSFSAAECSLKRARWLRFEPWLQCERALRSQELVPGGSA